jgi:hypothetical protein
MCCDIDTQNNNDSGQLCGISQLWHLSTCLIKSHHAGLGELEFYSGCQVLGFHCSDSDAQFLYDQQLKKGGLGMYRSHSDSSANYKQNMRPLSVDSFIEWAVRYACVTLMGEPEFETPAEARARQVSFLSRELEDMAGE